MTGCAIITDAITVVVAEGGPKAQKRYKKLLLDRMKWNAVPDDEDGAAAAAARCASWPYALLDPERHHPRQAASPKHARPMAYPRDPA